MKKLLMTASSWGHIRHFHLPYLRGFKQMGWEVHVGCANTPDCHENVDKFLELAFTKKMTALQNFTVARQLRGKIKAEDYDLIICHTSLAAFFTRLAVKGLSHRPKVINMVHGYLFDDETPAMKKVIYWGAEKMTASVTDVVLTMNQWDTDYARRHKLGAEVNDVLGIGVDFSPYLSVRFSPERREVLGIPKDAFVMIYPAEFSKRKNQQMLIYAMEQLPERVHLVLAGRGDLLTDCQALATQLGVDHRVRFPGFVDEMAEWYEIADVAVSASRSEGLPFNVMEAMACGLPVIASDVKGHRDLVNAPEIGRLYPYGDTRAFVSAVQHQMEQIQSSELIHNRRMAVAPYGLNEVYSQVFEAYEVAAATIESMV